MQENDYNGLPLSTSTAEACASCPWLQTKGGLYCVLAGQLLAFMAVSRPRLRRGPPEHYFANRWLKRRNEEMNALPAAECLIAQDNITELQQGIMPVIIDLRTRKEDQFDNMQTWANTREMSGILIEPEPTNMSVHIKYP